MASSSRAAPRECPRQERTVLTGSGRRWLRLDWVMWRNRLNRGAGLTHQQEDERRADHRDACQRKERRAAAEMVEQVAGEDSAERRSNADRAADDAEPEAVA